jgi:hypothetical protein
MKDGTGMAVARTWKVLVEKRSVKRRDQIEERNRPEEKRYANDVYEDVSTI